MLASDYHQGIFRFFKTIQFCHFLLINTKKFLQFCKRKQTSLQVFAEWREAGGSFPKFLTTCFLSNKTFSSRTRTLMVGAGYCKLVKLVYCFAAMLLCCFAALLGRRSCQHCLLFFYKCLPLLIPLCFETEWDKFWQKKKIPFWPSVVK